MNRSTPSVLQSQDAIRAARIAARITDDVLDYKWNNSSNDVHKFASEVLTRRYFDLDEETISNIVTDTVALIEDWKARAHEDEPDEEYGIVRFSPDGEDSFLHVPVAGRALGNTIAVDIGKDVSSIVSSSYTYDRVTGRVTLFLEEFHA